LCLDPPSSAPDRIRANVAAIAGGIEAARRRGAHAADAVELVVVTKSIGAELFPALDAAGVRAVGENRVQSAARRRPLAPSGWTWHGIGHLQRNKARTAVQVFDVLHAVDSLPLARRLDEVLADSGRRAPVYLQVNASGDQAKGGFEPAEALAALAAVARLPALQVLGWMTMAMWGAEEGDLRSTFRTLREIRDEGLRRGLAPAGAQGLSMGMSNDFEIAVEEGATLVRVGRAVFEGVDNSAASTRNASGTDVTGEQA
jgi:hypothetical protein